MPQDGIYRAILWVLALTVVAGALFAILGETTAHDPVMVRVGAGVALAIRRGRREALTMPRIACGLPPARPLARRIARAISMGHY